VIIRLNDEEREALLKYESGPFGDESLHSFMAEMCARMQDGGEIDIDRDDRERMQDYSLQGEAKRLRIDKVFKRPVEEAFKEFFE
jgi:hypothetical protein